MMSREVSPFYMNAHCELCSRTHDDTAYRFFYKSRLHK